MVKQYQELLGVIADPDYGDIQMQLMVEILVLKDRHLQKAGNQYGKTTVRVKPNQTPITEDADMLKVSLIINLI